MHSTPLNMLCQGERLPKCTHVCAVAVVVVLVVVLTAVRILDCFLCGIMGVLDLFNAGLSPERYSRGPRSQDEALRGGGGL